MSKTVLFQTIQFSLHSLKRQLNGKKTSKFQTFKFSIITKFNFIWPIDGTLSGLLGKSFQSLHETVQCSRHNYQPLNLTVLFMGNSESLIHFETAPAATFLHRRPLRCSDNYHSCTADHFTAAAITTPAPAATSLQKQLTVLHQRPLFLYQQIPATTSPGPANNFLHQQIPVQKTSDHFPGPADTSNYQSWISDHFPAPADTSNYQSRTSDYFPAPADTSNYPSWTSEHLPAPADTSPGPANTFLHQQIPFLNQRPPIQRIPVLYQLSRPAPATRSCSNDHHPDAAIVRRTLFRFTIRHNKVWPFEEHPCFVILA